MIYGMSAITTTTAGNRVRVVLLGAIAAMVWLVALTSPARAWEFVDAMNSYGDQATGIVQPARADPDTVLAIGCDGDRWRVAMIAPRSERGLDLGPDPDDQVSFSFGPELGPPGRWQVRKRQGALPVLLAPEPTAFVSRLVREERKTSDAVLRVGVRGREGKRVLEFPLAGLRAAIRRDLWKPCKLENYFPDAEGES